MQGAGKFVVLLLLLVSAHPAAGEDEHKLGKMLHRLTQDIAQMMTDVTALIMRQDSQQQDIATLMSDGKTQQQDSAQMMIDVKTLIMRQDSQHEEEAEDIAQLKSDVKSIKFHQERELWQHQEEAEDFAQLMTDVKALITFHERQELRQQQEEEAERRGIRSSCTRSGRLNTLLVDGHPMSVPCDDNGAVLILRRIDDKGNFSGRGWEDYKNGFGDTAGSFWLGLENMHRLTNAGSAKLRVELEAWDGETRWAQYSHVLIQGESKGYRLLVDGYTGNAGDSLAYSNGHKFSTIDVDNDNITGAHCAEYWNAGWWYTKCYEALLTGSYVDHGELEKRQRGIKWKGWKGIKYSMKKALMKLILD